MYVPKRPNSKESEPSAKRLPFESSSVPGDASQSEFSRLLNLSDLKVKGAKSTTPGKSEPGKTEPGKTEPAKTEAGKTEAGKTEPAKPEVKTPAPKAAPPAPSKSEPAKK